jgi:hypothetical protein
MNLSDHSQEISSEDQILRSSIEEIKELILIETPLGMNMEDVVKVVKGHNEWGHCYINYEHGTYYGAGIGEKSINTNIGHYNERDFWKFRTDVIVW